MSKESVSKNYMERMKAKHAWKGIPLPCEREILITGDTRKSSIGEAIRLGLPKSMKAYSYHDDVREGLCLPEKINTLIMCHGVTHLDWLEDIDCEKIQEIFDVNVVSVARMIGEFVNNSINQSFRKQIIVIGSMAHKSVLNGSASYCASKAALNMFCRCAAWELAPKGYDVFCINPSNVEGTPMTEETIAGLQRYRNLSRESAIDYWGASLPRQAWLQPSDISNLVNFLLSGKGDYLSGAALDLGGGQR